MIFIINISAPARTTFHSTVIPHGICGERQRDLLHQNKGYGYHDPVRDSAQKIRTGDNHSTFPLLGTIKTFLEKVTKAKDNKIVIY